MFTGKKLSKICAKAADIIQRDGLLKGEFGTNDGPKCAVGALRYANHGNTAVPLMDVGMEADQVHNLFRAVRPRSPRIFIDSYNDAPRTRKHDVVQLLLDMAAKALEG